MTSRDLRWLTYFQNAAAAALAVFHAVGGAQAAVDLGGVVVEAVGVVGVVTVVAVADLGDMVDVVPVEVAVVHTLLLSQKKKSLGIDAIRRSWSVGCIPENQDFSALTSGDTDFILFARLC